MALGLSDEETAALDRILGENGEARETRLPSQIDAALDLQLSAKIS